MKNRTQTVVVGTTLTEKSDEVVKTAAAIARAMGAGLHLVKAFEGPYVLSGGASSPAAQIRRLALGAAESVTSEVVEGPPHRMLAWIAHRMEAALVVVGATDTRLAHSLGSTASRLVRRCERPVLVLRGGLPVPPRKVLLPTDLSPLSGAAVEAGLELLGQMTGGGAGRETGAIAIEALTVLPHPDLGAQAAALTRLGEFLAAHRGGVRRIDRSIGAGGVRDEILAAIDDDQPDLVIVGTHGGSGFDALLLGSVAETVVRASSTSVLVIPPRAADGALDPHGASPRPAGAERAA